MSQSSNSIVFSIHSAFCRSFSLLETFIDVCPEEIWAEKSGGWPVWQQVYHSLTGLDFFIGPVGTPSQYPFGQEVGGLAVVSDKTLPKADAARLATEAKARVEAYVATLTDADLAVEVPRLSAILGTAVSHGMVLAMLGSHTLYHLGSCDAALRNHGLKGVF